MAKAKTRVSERNNTIIISRAIIRVIPLPKKEVLERETGVLS
eukprot:jgi/Picsp_1/1698/NSC_05172-R1_---NA---